MARGADDVPEFPGLALLLDGYFHEDFRAEHGSHETAARAFAREASATERAQAADALQAFLEWAADVDVAQWQLALHRTGGAWRPRTLGPLREVLEILSE